MFVPIERTGFGNIEDAFGVWIIAHARVWSHASRVLAGSSVANNRPLRWDETDGAISPVPQPSKRQQEARP